MRRIRTILFAAVAAGLLSVMATAIAAAHVDHSTDEWPMTCVDLNDVVEEHLGNLHNVGIYQNTFGDQAEAACQNDHRDDVRGVFAWAFGASSATPAASPPTASLPLVDPALYSAVWRGQTEQARALIAAGVNVNVRTSDNDPLLYEAAWRGNTEMAQILIDAGADVNARDSDGDPLLHTPVWRGFTTMARILIDAGADVDTTTSDNDPVLYEAVWRGNTEMAQILIDAGADVNARDSDGDPLLYTPVWRGSVAMVRILVDAGADVNATTSNGDTLFYEATWRGRTEILQILLAAQSSSSPAQTDQGWPTDCVELNDIVESHLGNDNNVGIYQSVFGDQAEQGCRGDHREDVRSVFSWAFD